MIISDQEADIGQIDLDGVLAVIITSRGASFTSSLINEVGDRNIPVIICNAKFHPVSVITPLVHHNDQYARYEAQTTAKKGIKSKLWQWIVINKVTNQHRLLALHQSHSAMRLKRLSNVVRPGDPENVEAQAAQVYWPALFGSDFRRDRDTEGINSLLNYGYTIIRSLMLRAILASGLHPTFGLFHRSRKNALCLVDDLMEPYRPIIDQIVKQLVLMDVKRLTVEAKRSLASFAAADQTVVGSVSPMFRHMQQLTYDINELYQGHKIKLKPPQLLSELEVSGIVSQC